MRIIKYLSIAIATIFAALFLVAAYYTIPIWSKLPSGAKLRHLSEAVETRMDKMPDHVHLALLAAEQPSFLTEGPNAISCTIALLVNGRNCGATISYQAARNILRNKSPSTRQPNQAFRYFIMTVKVEYYLTSEQILELVLNQTNFGRNTYGVAQAAQLYFAKAPANLTLAQSALLAGLIKAPTRYSPFVNTERALKRRNHILEMMVIFKMTTDAEGTAAMTEPFCFLQ